MSDTPRTDANEWRTSVGDLRVVDVGVARRLERELAVAESARDEARRMISEINDENERLRAELADAIKERDEATAWIPCAERLPGPGQPVLVMVGKSVLRAMHAPHLTLSEDDWGEFEPHADYDEATDRTYWPEGWYESDQHEERQFRLEREPTHWMPLPKPPRDAKGGGA